MNNTHSNQVRYKYLVLLLCITVFDQQKAAAGERRRASDVCGHSKCSGSIVVVVVEGSAVGVQQISFFIHESHPGWGGTATNIQTKMYCCGLKHAVYNKQERRRSSDVYVCTQQIHQQYSI